MGVIQVQRQAFADYLDSNQYIADPLSLVRELVENSIDASSKNINIVFEDESTPTVAVYDDGCGIDEKDAEQLFKRGFSSKHLGGFFGYKGEALYFLSRLSRSVEIESKSPGTSGFKLEFAAGESHITHHSSITSGTRVRVQDPFYLVPVRKTEWIKRRPWHCSKVMDYVKFCSIIYPIRFHLKLSWKKDVSFVSVPHESIVDRVKYAAQTKTADLITTTIENFDCSAILVPNSPSFRMVSLNHRQFNMNICLEDTSYGYFVVISSSNVHQADCGAKGTSEGRGLFLPSLPAINHWLNTATGASPVTPRAIGRPSGSPAQSKLSFSEIRFVDNSEVQVNALSVCDIECLQIVGQFNNGFIIAISEQKTGCSLVVIDQHGADERGFYESFKFQRHGLSVQKLIQPHVLNMDFEKIHTLSRCKPALQQLGFEIEEDQFGTKLVTVPVIMGTACSAEDVYDIVASDLVVEKNRTSLDLFMATKACKSAVKICQPLDNARMRKIVERIAQLENPWICAHGRNTVCAFHLLYTDQDGQADPS